MEEQNWSRLAISPWLYEAFLPLFRRLQVYHIDELVEKYANSDAIADYRLMLWPVLRARFPRAALRTNPWRIWPKLRRFLRRFVQPPRHFCNSVYFPTIQAMAIRDLGGVTHPGPFGSFFAPFHELGSARQISEIYQMQGSRIRRPGEAWYRVYHYRRILNHQMRDLVLWRDKVLEYDHQGVDLYNTKRVETWRPCIGCQNGQATHIQFEMDGDVKTRCVLDVSLHNIFLPLKSEVVGDWDVAYRDYLDPILFCWAPSATAEGFRGWGAPPYVQKDVPFQRSGNPAPRDMAPKTIWHDEPALAFLPRELDVSVDGVEGDFFGAFTGLFPSSFASESVAILAALCTYPSETITLRCDNTTAVARLNTSILGGPSTVAELYRGGLFTIWRQIDNVVSARQQPLRVEWIPGHSGIEGNERADRAAGL
ncbi:hypothetical protein HDU97_010082, partial [Phlyctochytrium planicorne]